MPLWLGSIGPQLETLWAYAKPNAMLLATTMAVGAMVEKGISASLKLECRYPKAIASNLQLMTALTALEDVLPNPRLMANLVRLCEGLCQLEFKPYLGARYLALEMVSQIETEVKRFRVIPWLTEDLADIEAGIMEAVKIIETNISANF
jgi:hypothetical protein